MRTRKAPPLPKERSRACEFQVRSETLDEEKRQVDITLATEAVTDMGYFREALLMSGAEYGKQIPFLDSHSRRGVSNILGSMTNLRIEDDKLVATVRFADSEGATSAFGLVRDGHLTDFSVGYRILEETFVKNGVTETIEGKSFEGPVYVVTRWKVREGSAVAIGADENAKVREEGSKPEDTGHTTQGVLDMKPEDLIRQYCKAAGCAERADKFIADGKTPDQVLATLETERAEAENKPKSDPTPEPEQRSDDTVDKLRKLQEREDIRELCKIAFGSEGSIKADEYIRENKTLETVRADIIKKREDENKPLKRPSVETGRAAEDKFRAAAVDGLLLAAGIAVEKPAEGAEELRGNPSDIAREYLVMKGERAPVDRELMYRKAFSLRSGARAHFRGRSSVLNHSTSDFPLLLADVANKALQSGYEEAGTTYQAWTRSVNIPDFKNRNVIALSEAPELVTVNEAGEITEGALDEKREQYALATYARKISITRQTLINDDLDAFTRLPRMMGAAAARVPNRLAYKILTANANLSDGVALFASGHSNLAGSGGAISVTTLGAARAAMMKQGGLLDANNDGEKTMLNIIPRYLIVTPDSLTVAEQVIGSVVDPSKSNAAHNPFANRFQVISDAELVNATSPDTDDWFLAADPSQIDTVEVGFLNGVQAPTIEETEEFDVLGMRLRVYLDCAAKAIDYRGLYKNPGS